MPKNGKGNVLSATSPQTGRRPGAAARDAGAPPRRLGLALTVIATAQLMVVLDTTIVNVALPHIQDALHFSGSSLEWVVNGYTLAFGGLLLLGGRSGDLLGRRRIFIFGILLFTAASLIGGLATGQAWLLTARAVQGVGAAFAAPTALSLIAVTFPEGAAEPGDGRVRGDERGRRLGRADRRRPARQLRRLAVGAVRQRADRYPRRAARAAGAQRVGAAARELRPAGRGHRVARPLRLGLRPVQRRHHRQRRLALGGHQGHRLAHGGGGAARGLCRHRGAQQARAASGAGAAQPRPLRRLPDRAVRGHGAVRDVLLPHPLPAGRLGL